MHIAGCEMVMSERREKEWRVDHCRKRSWVDRFALWSWTIGCMVRMRQDGEKIKNCMQSLWRGLYRKIIIPVISHDRWDLVSKHFSLPASAIFLPGLWKYII